MKGISGHDDAIKVWKNGAVSAADEPEEIPIEGPVMGRAHRCMSSRHASPGSGSVLPRGPNQESCLSIVEPIRYGSWCGRKTEVGYKDIIVAVKAN